jgi:hypothetical protein
MPISAFELFESVLVMLRNDTSPVVIKWVEEMDKKIISKATKNSIYRFITYKNMVTNFHFRMINDSFDSTKYDFLDKIYTYSHDKVFLFQLKVAIYRTTLDAFWRAKINPVTKAYYLLSLSITLTLILLRRYWIMVIVSIHFSMFAAVFAFLFLQVFGFGGYLAIVVFFVTLYWLLRGVFNS